MYKNMHMEHLIDNIINKLYIGDIYFESQITIS